MRQLSMRLEQWDALLDVQASETRSVGVSNFNESHLDEIADAGLQMPDANQIELLPGPETGSSAPWPSITSRLSPTAALSHFPRGA